MSAAIKEGAFRKNPIPEPSCRTLSSFSADDKFEEKIERLLNLALALTSQEWNRLGLGDDPLTKPTADRVVLVERIASLLLIRCAAIVLAGPNPDGQGGSSEKPNRASPVFFNLSTSNVCQQLLNKTVLFPFDVINEQFVNELYEYVRRMLLGYKDVPYHNCEHAYHVILSVNKLIDMMVSSKNKIVSNTVDENGNSSPPIPTPKATTTTTTTCEICPYVTYGLRHDPLALFALMFAALIHDVEHQGIPNRQLSLEDDRLAVLYNDQSMAENWSLYVCFSELLQEDFVNFRTAIMMKDKNDDEYRRFRKYVVGLVLSTDIASPDRTQLNKSKWKEAFGDTYETIERKLKAMNSNELGSLNRRLSGRHLVAPRRTSQLSAISCLGEDELNNSGSIQTTEYDYDESLSGTPDVSDSEKDGDNKRGVIKEQPKSCRRAPEPHGAFQKKNRRASVQAGYIPATVERRLSMAASVHSTADTSKYRQRLGILRTVDLSGETIEAYTRRGSMVSVTSERAIPALTPGSSRSVMRNSSLPLTLKPDIHFAPDKIRVDNATTANPSTPPFCKSSSKDEIGICQKDGGGTSSDIVVQPIQYTSTPAASSGLSLLCPSMNYDADEPDELKASVVMETIMVAADVAHNLQGWDHMVKWSTRLYMELRRAFIAKRGFDPSDRWFQNQIGFLESYLLPVARRLEDTGVFHEMNIGLLFSSTVESNRDKWLKDGAAVTAEAIQEGDKQFPLPQN